MSEERIFVVDRLEGRQVVLTDDDENEIVLPRQELPIRPAEGMVLRVHMIGETPDWSTARADPEEQQRRLAKVQRKMRELRQKDPGGDLEL